MAVNLDPAAELFTYRCDVDIREAITLDDAMEEMELGPNGGLVFALEYFTENIDWFQEKLENFGDNDYLLIDCPGQVELYTHLDVLPRLISCLREIGFAMCAVYCTEATFLHDVYKFCSASLCALSAMNALGLPHWNVLTK
jgi:GTPase SAR1 family protein